MRTFMLGDEISKKNIRCFRSIIDAKNPRFVVAGAIGQSPAELQPNVQSKTAGHHLGQSASRKTKRVRSLVAAFLFLFLLGSNATPTRRNDVEQEEVILEHLNRQLSPALKDRPHCPATRPFLCPDSNICISLIYLCDDSPGDCPNNLDEDSQLCTAKKRFAVDAMELFLEALGMKTVLPVFGKAAADIVSNEGGYLEIANAFATSKTDIDFAKNIGMSQEDLENLRDTEEALRNGNNAKLRRKSVPENIITDLRFFFGKLRDTGFFE